MLNHAAVVADVARSLGEVRGDAPVAVLVLRTQGMREFGHAFGYAAVEILGHAMHDALVAAVRPGDRVLRIGLHDFVVVLPDLRGRAHAGLGAAKCLRVLQQSFLIEGGLQTQPSVVAGIAVAPLDGEDAELLCRRADQACDDALGNVERQAFWKAPPVPLETLHRDLRAAIAEGQLVLFLQPIAALPSRRVTSYEALTRWTHPTLGEVRPDLFIAAAERGGLINDLTRWSLNVALRHLARLRRAGRQVRIAVNMSVEALQAPGFVEQVLDLLRLWDVPGDALVLEITESALMRDVVRCSHLLEQIRRSGVRIAIDDFGTGYSSLAYLRRLPIDSLKIDRSFISDMTGDARARRIVRTMIDLGHDLDLSVVAEGIEDDAALGLLQQDGCDFVQGYLLGRPADAEVVVAAAIAGCD